MIRCLVVRAGNPITKTLQHNETRLPNATAALSNSVSCIRTTLSDAGALACLGIQGNACHETRDRGTGGAECRRTVTFQSRAEAWLPNAGAAESDHSTGGSTATPSRAT